MTIQEVRATGTSPGEASIPRITPEDAISFCRYIRYAVKHDDAGVINETNFGQGIFIPEDRTVYFVGGVEPYAIVHELGHALDYSLDPPAFSSLLPSVYGLAFSARLTVPIYQGADPELLPTPYAAQAPTECWAESFALWCGATSAFEAHRVQAPIATSITDVFAALARGEDVAQPPPLFDRLQQFALLELTKLQVAAYHEAVEKDPSL